MLLTEAYSAHNTINLAKTVISVSYGVKLLVEKEENVGYQHFLLCTQCPQEPSSLELCGEELNFEFNSQA